MVTQKGQPRKDYGKWTTLKDDRRVFIVQQSGKVYQGYREEEEIPENWETEHRKVSEEVGYESIRRYRNKWGPVLIQMVADAALGDGKDFEDCLTKLSQSQKYKHPDWLCGFEEPYWLNKSEEVIKTVRDIDYATNKGKVLEDVVLWRGVSDKLGEAIFRRRKSGGVYRARTYSSTSFLKKVAKRFLPDYEKTGEKGYLVKILAPKGLPGLYIGYKLYPEDPSSDEDVMHVSDREFILPRNANFRYLGRCGRVIGLEYIGVNVKK